MTIQCAACSVAAAVEGGAFCADCGASRERLRNWEPPSVGRYEARRMTTRRGGRPVQLVEPITPEQQADITRALQYRLFGWALAALKA